MSRSDRRAAFKAMRLEQQASRLRRFADRLRGPVADTRRRRLLAGKTVPVSVEGRTWQDLVAPGPRPTGGALVNPKHPSRKHDSPLAVRPVLAKIEHAPPGSPRRRDRRRPRVATGGGMCPCGARVTFYEGATQDDYDDWDRAHQECA
jgi:hypothetical protein